MQGEHFFLSRFGDFERICFIFFFLFHFGIIVRYFHPYFMYVYIYTLKYQVLTFRLQNGNILPFSTQIRNNIISDVPRLRFMSVIDVRFHIYTREGNVYKYIVSISR